ncbi:hypothetical protein ALC56_13768 [Trachymyrmex septentrionalis]|uniref:Uncharacterized protein n=1 Tax=Trachymyrmex septentrionalis TaxID=34720 RepID=A0A195EUS8_9HYME|nr:hypothetical protein ALC56_13768 [Trachymyrmex septentrionalis]
MNRRTNPPDYPPERMVLLSNVNHTHRRRFAPPAMFSNQGDNFSIGKRANAEGLEYSGKTRYMAKEGKKKLLQNSNLQSIYHSNVDGQFTLNLLYKYYQHFLNLDSRNMIIVHFIKINMKM